MSKKTDPKSERRKTKASGSKRTAPKPAVPDPAKAPSRRRTRMIALEPRMLFDGALGVDLGGKASAALAFGEGKPADAAADATAAPAAPEQPQTASEKAQAERNEKPAVEGLEPPGTAARNEIVFVDASVEGYEALLADVNPDARVVLLDPTRDGIKQILEHLENEWNVDAVHIVSHGAEGLIALGSATLNAESMRGPYAADLAEIGAHLGEEADILVYGCDFAKGDAGREAVEILARTTGADVAASEDVTGAVGQGGDAELEKKLGALETNALLTEQHFANWGGTLALVVNDGGAVNDADMVEAVSADGITVESTTRGSSSNSGLGTFAGLQTNGNPLLEQGIVIATGNVNSLVADGTAGNSASTDLGGGAIDTDDPDLAGYAAANGINYGQNDVSRFEMDFTSDVRKLAVVYVFGTEETYQYAVNQNYNDLFGIFLRDYTAGTTTTVAAHHLRGEYTGGTFIANADTAGTGNVETNNNTGVLTSVIDLNDHSGTGGSYGIKFEIGRAHV